MSVRDDERSSVSRTAGRVGRSAASVGPAALTAALVLSNGCESDACKHGTHELSMIAVVTDYGESVRAQASFDVGDRGPLELSWALCEDDRLRVNGRDATVIRKPGETEYAVTFSDAEASEHDWRFEYELARLDETVRTTVELPKRFAIWRPSSSSAAQDEISRQDDLAVRWVDCDPECPDPTDDETMAVPACALAEGDESDMTLALEEDIGDGICLEAPNENYRSQDGVRIDGRGHCVIRAGDLLGTEAESTCTVLLRLTRSAFTKPLQTQPPQAFASGFAEGRVVRGVSFTSVP